MTDIEMKSRDEKNKLFGEFNAYSEIADMAIANCEECISKHYDGESEVWLNIATVCVEKREKIISKLEELKKQLKEIG